ncbi:MAG: hypothetical protein ACLT2Z_06850 [Eubacterium sp.]
MQLSKPREVVSGYINDRNLPDKAIDLVDEACSKIRIRGSTKAEIFG